MVNDSMSPADISAVVNGGNRGGWASGLNGDSLWWVLILFLFMIMMGGNWGNNRGNDSQPSVVVASPAMGGGYYGAPPYAIQQSFDQMALVNSINSLANSVNTGFATAEVSRCNNQMANMTAMNTLAQGIQQNTYDTRSNIADLKSTVLSENCADRNALAEATRDIIANQNAGFQSIKDQMCQDTINRKDDEIAALRNQLNMAALRESQTAQTAQIIADNTRQTSILNPAPIPAYIVQNPSCCNPMNNRCCGNG